MNYQTGKAFRSALETRLLTQSTQGTVSLVRLRKLVAFDRFLARLLAVQPESWLLKGGLALQLRLGQRARTTQDMDMLLRLPRPEVRPFLLRAAGLTIANAGGAAGGYYAIIEPVKRRLVGAAPATVTEEEGRAG